MTKDSIQDGVFYSPTSVRLGLATNREIATALTQDIEEILGKYPYLEITK